MNVRGVCVGGGRLMIVGEVFFGPLTAEVGAVVHHSKPGSFNFDSELIGLASQEDVNGVGDDLADKLAEGLLVSPAEKELGPRSHLLSGNDVRLFSDPVHLFVALSFELFFGFFSFLLGEKNLDHKFVAIVVLAPQFVGCLHGSSRVRYQEPSTLVAGASKNLVGNLS